MNAALPGALPGELDLLLRGTVLLAFAWMIHGWVRHRHARWRMWLWRGVLVAVLGLPIASLFSVPTVSIALRSSTAKPLARSSQSRMAPVGDGANAALVQDAASVLGESIAEASATRGVGAPRPEERPGPSRGWKGVLVGLWLTGVGIATLRLVRTQRALNALRRATRPAGSEWEGKLEEVQRRLGWSRPVGLRISAITTSPFACGLWRPEIVVPESLVDSLSGGEIEALLAHEVAHVRRGDLGWCLAWRGLAVLAWFHPLVWGIPAVHNLACEQEADRLAASQVAGHDVYRRLLASLSLRLLALPRAETLLTTNGSSQLVRRLAYLQSASGRTWGSRSTAMAFILALLLGFVGVGWRLVEGPAAQAEAASASAPAKLTDRDFGFVTIRVIDEQGRPVEGAAVHPDGLRVKGPHSVSHHGWDPQRHGSRTPVVTDASGQARLRYPLKVMAEERFLTGQISFSVNAVGFVIARPTEFVVDGSAPPVRLERAATLEVTAYFGPERQRVERLVPWVSGECCSTSWRDEGGGTFVFDHLAAGQRLLQVSGQLDSGELVFAEGQALNVAQGERLKVAVEMKRGLRLEGQLDARVSRPVRKGRVVIAVRPRSIPAFSVPEEQGDLLDRLGEYRLWTSYRPIAEDGSFAFEAIPSGEVDVTVQGEGFVSKNGAEARNRIQRLGGGVQFVPSVICVPQAFALVAPLTRIEVLTEPTATLEVQATGPRGRPVQGAQVWLYPNVLRMPGGLFCEATRSDEEPFRRVERLPELRFHGVTSQEGIAVVANLPAHGRGFDLEHAEYEVPADRAMKDRWVRIQLAPGETHRVDLRLQKKGKQFVGELR